MGKIFCTGKPKSMLHAIVFIKQESERLPGKNFLDFCGRPLYRHILRTLQEIEAIDKILVNTDSPEVQAYCQDHPKLCCHWRPEHLKGRLIGANEIIAYDIAQSEAEHFIQTHVTNPLVHRSTFEAAIQSYFSHLDTHDCLLSVDEIQARMYRADGSPLNHTLGRIERLQDMDPLYKENSLFFLFSKKTFEQHHGRVGTQPLLYVTPRWESVDIDYQEDFELAEWIASTKLKHTS